MILLISTLYYVDRVQYVIRKFRCMNLRNKPEIIYFIKQLIINNLDFP